MDELFNCFVVNVEDAVRMVNGRRELITIYISRVLLDRFCYSVTMNGVTVRPKTFRGVELKILDIPADFYCVGFGYYRGGK